jgi:enolase-phosphatase E1
MNALLPGPTTMPIRAIVTDIEGTTSSIAFVKDVLFPYARRALPDFVARRGRDPEVRRWLDAAALDIGGVVDDDCIVELLQQWIDEDRKHTALKALQGMIWKDGYARGDYTAHVYPDTPRKLREWHAAGLPLYVYSSGSVPAQKLFFAYTDAGDLTPLFSGYFDTEIGAKREPESYARILQAIGRPGPEVLFLSDVEAELDAAATNGMRTTLLVREGVPPADSTHPVASDFDGVELD